MSEVIKNILKKKSFNLENVSLCPELPGIYLFYDSHSLVLYVGKSRSLKNRLKSYLGTNLGTKTTELVRNTKTFGIIVVNSEIESLLLESFLVKKYMPKYNIQLKDDKTPLYIVIVKDKYPWVKTARKSDLGNIKGITYGPFLSGKNVHIVLKTFRRIFPYAMHKQDVRPCFYSHIGLCNPCPSKIAKCTDEKQKHTLELQYKKNIDYLKKALNGKVNNLLLEFEKEMKQTSQREDFENASFYKEKIDAINYIIHSHEAPSGYFENPNLIEDIIDNEINRLQKLVNIYYKIDNLKRIECYDIAHISGNFPTASMVTFINGVADKSFYRHFRIRQTKGNSDTDSLLEVAKRRVRYLTKWGRPDLIIVDGGKGQVSKFNSVFKSHNIPVVGIAKREETLVFMTSSPSVRIQRTLPPKEDDISGSIHPRATTRGFLETDIKNQSEYVLVKLKRGPALNFVQKIRNEAHRFARRYHHILIKRNLVGIIK